MLRKREIEPYLYFSMKGPIYFLYMLYKNTNIVLWENSISSSMSERFFENIENGFCEFYS